MQTKQVSDLINRLAERRKPWSKSMHIGVLAAFEKQGLGDVEYVSLNGEVVHRAHYSLGASNLLALAARGKLWGYLTPPERFDATNACQMAAWQKVDDGWGWEAATLYTPEQMGVILDNLRFPTLPRDFWRRNATVLSYLL